jgi:hypothetical protein
VYSCSWSVCSACKQKILTTKTVCGTGKACKVAHGKITSCGSCSSGSSSGVTRGAAAEPGGSSITCSIVIAAGGAVVVMILIGLSFIKKQMGHKDGKGVKVTQADSDGVKANPTPLPVRGGLAPV